MTAKTPEIHGLLRRVERGGPGSGHHGHEGRPGEVGGSRPGESITTTFYSDQTVSEIEAHNARLVEELDDWDLDVRDRGSLSRKVAANGARINYVNNTELVERRMSDGELVAIASIREYDSSDVIEVVYLASKRAGHGGPMMLEIAREAVRRGRGLAGNSTAEAFSFYMGLAEAMGVADEVEADPVHDDDPFTDVDITIADKALALMIQPLAAMTIRGKAEAIEFYKSFDETAHSGVYFHSVERPIERGGPGSGHHGHEGRPGQVGGSAPSSETVIEVGNVGEAPGSRVADKQAARSAVRELRERGTISLLNPRDIVFGVRHDDGETSVVFVNASEWQGTIHLESIMVPTGEQGRGAASFILDEILIPTADKYGVEITAIAEPIGESGLSKKALIRWYLRHGFELVDTSGGDDIIYRPQGAAVARGGPGSGHHGHEGRPGEVGGSQPSGAAGGSLPGDDVGLIADRLRVERELVGQARYVLNASQLTGDERGKVWLSPSGLFIALRGLHEDNAYEALTKADVEIIEIEDFGIDAPTNTLIAMGFARLSIVFSQISYAGPRNPTPEQAEVLARFLDATPLIDVYVDWYDGLTLTESFPDRLQAREELEAAVSAAYRMVGRSWRRFRHYGPGSHPGTGTDQEIHAGDGGGAQAEAEPLDNRSRDWRAISDGFHKTSSITSPFELTQQNYTAFWLSPDGSIFRVSGQRHEDFARKAIEEARQYLSPSFLADYDDLKSSYLTDSPALDMALQGGFVRGFYTGGGANKEIALTFDEAATELRRPQKQTLLDIFAVSPDREFDFVWAIYPTGGSHMPIESGRDRDSFMARFGIVERSEPVSGGQRAFDGFMNALASLEALFGGNGYAARGGPGSGHRGHKGRPGKVGGSQPSGGAATEGDRLDDERRRAVDMFRAGKGTLEGLALLLHDIDWYGSPEQVETAARRAGIPIWDINRFVEALRTTRMSYVVEQLNLYARGMPKFEDIMSTQADFVDEPLEGQSRRADISWGMPDRDPALIERLNEIEAEIGELPHEVAYVLTPGGDVILRKGGTVDEIRFTEAEAGQMEGAVMIHNHPSNSAFSDDDISIAIDTGALETIVVGRGGKRYIMGVGGYVGDVDREVVRRQAIGYYHAADDPPRQVFGPLVEQHSLSPVHASFYHGIEQWLRVERQMPDHIDFVHQHKDMK